MRKIILLAILLCGCQTHQLYKDTQVLMGTFVEVTSPEKKAAGIVFAEIKRMEALLSKYKPDSEISKLNALGKIKASPEVFYVIKKAKEFSEITDGAFDITVGPLMDLWGFTDKNYRLPDKEEIKQALQYTGADKIILDEDKFVVQFAVRGVRVDLGAIAKGYILDCAAGKLKESGVSSCLINAGGQVIALGDKPVRQWFGFPHSQSHKFGAPWKVAIRNPRKPQGNGLSSDRQSHSSGFSGYLELKARSVSTSGDYEQYFVIEGRRYAHILNPKTGYPVDNGILSVTVVARSGLVADALSTSIFVLGRHKGGELAAKYFPGAEVRIIEEKDVRDIK